MNDLLNKLKSLGLKVDLAVNLPAAGNRRVPIDQVIQGDWEENNDGRVFTVSHRYPYGYVHGKQDIHVPGKLEKLTWLLNAPSSIEAEKILFIDTETSSLSTGAGSFVFLIGLAWFGEHGLSLKQIFLDHPTNESPFLSSFERTLAAFTTFASFNGKAFDLPMLRSRFVLNRRKPTFEKFDHHDLLHTSRHIWKMRLESRRLADIEREILHFQRLNEEIPGWLVPQFYFDYLDSGDATPLQGVFYHNEMDVVSLAALMLHFDRLVEDQGMITEQDSRDVFSIGRVLGKYGHWEFSEGFFNSQILQQLPEENQREASRYCASVMKKQGKWEQAVQYWQYAAENKDPCACIELAKYYEHRQKEIDQALYWTNQALLLLDVGIANDRMTHTQTEHRLARLERKKGTTHHA